MGELLERKVLLDLQDPYLKANDARIGIAEPEDAGRSSSALLFKGAREVHAMLDVLRQFFLGSPLPSGFMPPANLPTLIAPVHFTYAAWRPAEVVSTKSMVADNVDDPSRHSAELQGFFFPFQLRRLVEQLRIVLQRSQRFVCQVSSESRHSAGINAFTRLGKRHIKTIQCA